MRNILIAAAAAASFLAGPALAGEGAWMGIGLRSISASMPSQTIQVAEGNINIPRETMFCSDDSAVQILTADFRYRNGETQSLQVRARVRAGDCSRIINLRNRNAELASVTFTADPASLAAGATARVRVLVR